MTRENPSTLSRVVVALDSPPETAHAQVVVTFFSRDQLIAFLKKQDEIRFPAETERETLADELLGLADSDFFRKRFAEHWTYESGPKWQGREIRTAVSETVTHMLSQIIVASDFLIHRGNRKYIGDFPDQTIEGVKKTQEQARLLLGCFHAQQRNSSL